MQQLHRKRVTGTVVITDQTRDESHVYLRDGSPVHVHRPVDTDRLDNLLVEYGVVSADAVAAASAQVVPGLRLGDVLERMGLLDRPKLAQILKAQVVRKLTRLFFVAEGNFAVYVESHAFGDGDDLALMRVDPRSLLFPGIRAAYALPRVTQEVSRLVGQRFRLREEVSDAFIAAMGIPAGEATVAALRAGWLTLDDLDAITSRPLEVRSVVLALYYADLLEKQALQPVSQPESDSAVPREVQTSSPSDTAVGLVLPNDVQTDLHAAVPTGADTAPLSPPRTVTRPIIHIPLPAHPPVSSSDPAMPHDAPAAPAAPAAPVVVPSTSLVFGEEPVRRWSPASGVPIAPASPTHTAPLFSSASRSTTPDPSHVQGRQPMASSSKPDAAASKPTAPPSRPTFSPEVLRAGIQDMAGKLAKGTHFELLGVGQGAGNDEVQSAFLKAARQFHPDRLASAGLQDLQPLAEKILARVNEAAMVLGDAKRRAEYVAFLAAPRSSSATAGAPPTSLPSVLEAENLFLKGEVFLKKGDHAKAVESFSGAVRANPQEPQYRAYLAWARFDDPRARKEAISRETLKTIVEVVRERPKFIRGFYWVGLLWKFLNEPDKAAQAFRETIALDPSFIDASRELRLIEMRKSKQSGNRPDGKSPGGLMGKFFKR